jgi:hypothetical protein
MKKHFIRIVTLFSFVFVLSVASTFAQSIKSVKVNIPFEFQAGKKTLPAGDYRIATPPATTSVRTLLLSEINGRANSFLNSSSIVTRDESLESSLVFHRYGDVYFLAEINVGNNKITLHRTRAEKELVARNAVEAESVSVKF